MGRNEDRGADVRHAEPEQIYCTETDLRLHKIWGGKNKKERTRYMEAREGGAALRDETYTF